MRILWLSHLVPFPPAGGALQRSFYLLRHAAAQHEVHLLALNQPRLLPTPAELSEAEEALSGFCESVRVFPLPAERSPLSRGTALSHAILGSQPYDVVWLRSRAMQEAVESWPPALGLDLVHVDTVGLWPYVQSLGHTPIVLGHHNIESDLTARRAAHARGVFRSALLRRDAIKLRKVEASAVRRPTVNTVVSWLDAERLHTIVQDAVVEVVENGVDTEYFKPIEGTKTRGGIVFSGTLGWYPNRDAVDFLLAEVWPALVQRRPAQKLTLVGRDPPPSAWAAAKDPRVSVTGFVPDARPYLDAAGVFVCPIRVGGGTRLKVLDALAMEKPVIATALAVEGLELVEGEHYLRAETASEFVTQIGRLEDQPEMARALGIAGRRLVVKRYDWRTIVRQLDVAYARAVDGRPRRGTAA